MKWINKNIEFFFYLISTFAIILVFKGFNYASNDVVDVMSYAKHLQDNTLFSNDFYVSHISTVVPNERYIFSTLLSLFGNALNWLPFFFHSIATLVFLMGLYRIFALFLTSKPLIWISILVLLLPLYKFNLGGNELFYNMFIASYVAKVFGIWAVYYFLKGEKFYSFILIIFSTLMHPAVGAQLFIIFVASGIVGYMSDNVHKINKKTLMGIGLYFVIAGVYIAILLKEVNNPGISDSEYFKIFEFRNAHHFFPQYFPLRSYYVELLLYVVGIYFMVIYKMEKLLNLSLVIILGIMIYLIGAFVFGLPLILSTQWFKSTIWLELFSLIAVMKYFENEFQFIKKAFFSKFVFTGLNATAMVVIIMALAGFNYFKQKPYRFVYGKNMSQEEDIGLKVKALTDKNAVFVYPMEFTGFKFYSERNAYIDFKSIVHRRDALGEWYKRINDIYGVDFDTRHSGKDIFKEAKKNFAKIDKSKLQYLKESGVEYIVEYRDVDLNLPVLVENSRYIVYCICPKTHQI